MILHTFTMRLGAGGSSSPGVLTLITSDSQVMGPSSSKSSTIWFSEAPITGQATH